MPQIFVTSSHEQSGRYTITGDDFHHLHRVLRVKLHDIIDLRHEDGSLVRARVSNIDDNQLIADEVERLSAQQPPVSVHVAISLLKGKKFDFVVQKLTEIGVASIVPLQSERSVPVLNNKEEHKKSRWLKISEAASKQSLRSEMPLIEGVQPLEAYLERIHQGARIIAHPGSAMQLRRFLSGNRDENTVHLLIGPEGGFSSREVALAQASGWEPVNFGITSMRAETAALVLPSIILYEWGS